jgi:hypothetical protein
MKPATIFILTIATASIIMMYLAIITSLPNHVAEATITELSSYRGFNPDDFNHKILRHFFDDEYDRDDHDKGRVFYSHSIMTYGTKTERVEKELIRDAFNDFGILSPTFYEEGNHEKRMDEMIKFYKGNSQNRLEDEMEFYKMIVSGCQMLVYSEWNNEITSGVAIEVNHAIDIGIPVFELVGNKFVPQKDHVDGLSYKETTLEYEQYSSSE